MVPMSATYTEPNCVRSSAKWAQNKCPLCLNAAKHAQMSTDIDQGSHFFQEDNGLQLRNRNIGQREVTVSKLTHREGLNLKRACFDLCMKAFGEIFAKRKKWSLLILKLSFDVASCKTFTMLKH